MEISKSIFRDYDIRGVYPDTLNEEIALLIGKALGTDFSKKGAVKVVVGRDDRKSSPALSKKLIEGLLSTGRDVTFIDITLNPVVHFLTCTKGFDAGIVVTASHNPKEYNGIRIFFKHGGAYFGKDIYHLLEIINEGNFTQGKGSYKEENLSLSYLDFIKKSFSFSKKMKVVVDCGNGAASLLAPQIFRDLGMEVIPVYCSYDSDFPNGVPDPENPKFIKTLSQKVLEKRADVGFGFDTDGDRFGFVDEKGQSYTTDRALLLFAKDLLSKEENKGKKVVFDVKCSRLVNELIPQFGGVPEMIRTGNAYFVQKVLSGEAVLGAEFAGHVYFSDKYFGYDDGVYAACRTLEILDRPEKKLSELMSVFPVTASSPEFKLPCSDEEKFKVIEDLQRKLTASSDFKNVITIDGVRVEISDTGWFLVRASNTSPYLSVRFEGADEKELKFLAKELLMILSPYDQIDLELLKKFIG